MSLAQSIRPLIPLVIGLAVGGVGATLFLQSMPGAEGSPEERANKLEVELKRAQNRIAALEDRRPAGPPQAGADLCRRRAQHRRGHPRRPAGDSR